MTLDTMQLSTVNSIFVACIVILVIAPISVKVRVAVALWWSSATDGTCEGEGEGECR
jgi:hypothetical protein